VSKDSDEAEVTRAALNEPNVLKFIGSLAIKKVVFVPNKIINFIV
jgi:leucyl-tRNA synthetase